MVNGQVLDPLFAVICLFLHWLLMLPTFFRLFCLFFFVLPLITLRVQSFSRNTHIIYFLLALTTVPPPPKQSRTLKTSSTGFISKPWRRWDEAMWRSFCIHPVFLVVVLAGRTNIRWVVYLRGLGESEAGSLDLGKRRFGCVCRGVSGGVWCDCWVRFAWGVGVGGWMRCFGLSVMVRYIVVVFREGIDGEMRFKGSCDVVGVV
jgi:hypothetical protein